jgi:hypothetical protein
VPPEDGPQLTHRVFVPDDHARSTPRGDLCEPAALTSGRDDVGTHVAERREAAVLGERREAAEPSARDVLEEDPLHGILEAELQDLVEPRLDRTPHGVNPRTG